MIRRSRQNNKRETIYEWSLPDTLQFKGIAIVMIVFHNFFHLVRSTPHENEFHFSIRNSHIFWNTIIGSPEEFIRCCFSFLGHYGVQIFIFLSAYGLTKKFMASQQPYLGFIKSRFLKIYPVFFLAIIFILRHQMSLAK